MSKGKTALITGASRGIGRAIASGLAADGWSIALLSRNKTALEDVASTLADTGVSVDSILVLSVDVTDRGAVQAAVSKTISAFRSIDLLVNNAGVNQAGTWELSEEEFESVLATNLTGAWNMIGEVVPIMKKQQGGHIMNVSSICGVYGFSGAGAYCASKFALQGLNESLFRELVPQGIKVTALCPSWVATDMARHAPIPDEQKLQPEDLLSAVRFLLGLSPAACLKEMVIQCRYDIC